MPLKIDLKAGEKFIINGAVVTVGKDGRSLVLETDAMLLRDRDVMQEAEADTPAKRIYFHIMLMYIDPDNRAIYQPVYERFMEDLGRGTGLAEIRTALGHIRRDVERGLFYRALKTCKAIIAVEAEILKIAPESTPESESPA
ncbi:MAG TPA: flagellar biosynthesis repressor FlbT [Alphaproteobacteria bacterium]|nr:flagellar biosynthesis repressor FlbT [Alphaproteobacteria bacterium]